MSDPLRGTGGAITDSRSKLHGVIISMSIDMDGLFQVFSTAYFRDCLNCAWSRLGELIRGLRRSATTEPFANSL
jgi:hypothetical protein